MNNIETVALVELTAAQGRAVRKLALRSSNKSAQELADNLLAQVIRGRFTAVAKNIAEDAGAKYDMAVAGGFEPPCTRAEYVSKAAEEYKDILSEL